MILFIYFVSYFCKIVKNNNGKVGIRNNNTIVMLSEPSYFIALGIIWLKKGLVWSDCENCGGHFTIVIPDDKNPDSTCTVFTLRNNNYNWWLPETGIQFILSRQLPAVFNLPREIIIEVRNKYFKYDEQLSFEEPSQSLHSKPFGVKVVRIAKH